MLNEVFLKCLMTLQSAGGCDVDLLAFSGESGERKLLPEVILQLIREVVLG